MSKLTIPSLEDRVRAEKVRTDAKYASRAAERKAADTSTLEGARYVLTVKNKTNRLHTGGSTEAGTPVLCLRKSGSWGYYVPCAAIIVAVKESGWFVVDLYPAGQTERVTVTAKAILWPETFRVVRCAVCSAEESIGGEISEKTLEDEGWYLGPTETTCPDHTEKEIA